MKVRRKYLRQVIALLLLLLIASCSGGEKQLSKRADVELKIDGETDKEALVTLRNNTNRPIYVRYDNSWYGENNKARVMYGVECEPSKTSCGEDFDDVPSFQPVMPNTVVHFRAYIFKCSGKCRVEVTYLDDPEIFKVAKKIPDVTSDEIERITKSEKQVVSDALNK
jgi:hypothetical protein